MTRGGAGVLWLAEPVEAKCCDGRLTFIVINREGRSYCISCDPGECR